MVSFDDIKKQADKVASVAKEKALEFAEAADDWASKEHPGMDKAFESAGEVAQGALDTAAKGAGGLYEAIKNKAEEALRIFHDSETKQALLNLLDYIISRLY